MLTVFELTLVVVPLTVKLPVITAFPLTPKSLVTVKSLPIVTSLGKPIVTLTSVLSLVTAVSISFVVPKNCKSSAIKSTFCVVLASSIVNIVARPVSPEPSPTNEPVIVEVPRRLPILFAEILLLPADISFANAIAFPSEDKILLPAVICIGASNSMLPVPLPFVSVISPFSVCSVIVSAPVSKSFRDSPASVCTVKSVPSVDSTCCPLIYNEPDDR